MISLNSPINGRLFQRLALVTISFLCLLILVGGIVRSTGSGMGCPDWPRCFGQWVPPTSVSELPANYQEIYSHRGYANTEFNVVKTWTEYLNRLLGVVIGLLIFATLVVSVVAYWKRDRAIVGYSFLALLLVGFQGWLGAKVVSSVLAAWLITLHMLVAIIILGILLYVVSRTISTNTFDSTQFLSRRARQWLVISFLLLVGQILLGTQVRETVDEVAKQFGSNQREQWISNLDLRFYIHRSFSLLVLLSQLFWTIPVFRKADRSTIGWRLAVSTIGLLISEVGVGVIMAYFAIPAWAQPVHLTLAIVALGIQFVAILFSYRVQLIKNVPERSVLYVD